jgi:hypothetical protein
VLSNPNAAPQSRIAFSSIASVGLPHTEGLLQRRLSRQGGLQRLTVAIGQQSAVPPQDVL